MPPKTSLKDKNKKLTDFFIPKPSPSASALAASNVTTATTTPAVRRASATRASTISTRAREPPINSAPPSELCSASVTMKRKRARSPDGSNSAAVSVPSFKTKSQRKVKRPLQSHPESRRSEVTDCVAFSHNAIPQKQTLVKLHNNSPFTSPSGSSKQVVYSSQSDEEELVLPGPESRDLGEVVHGVHAWRRKTFGSSSPSRLRQDAMEVDLVPSFPIRTSTVTRSASGRFDVSNITFADPSSPSPSDKPLSLPPTPQPVDSETKTAKLIAEIKARAFATQQSSDDEQHFLFRELEDSDDDDLIDDLPLTGGLKHKSPSRIQESSPLSSAPSSCDGSTVGDHAGRTPDRCSPSQRRTRVSERTRKPALGLRLPRTIAESSFPVSGPKPVTVPSNHKKPRAINPLQVLLREKEQEDKRGTSSVALRLAEEAARQDSRKGSADSDDDLGTLDQLHLVDEQAAWKAVQESRKSSSPIEPSALDDFITGDRESNMLGPTAREAINQILAGNKGGNRKESEQDNDRETSGVSLWMQPSDEDMVVEPISNPLLSGHSILTYLNDASRNDDSALGMVLRSGTLAAVPRDVLLANIPQLLTMALFAPSQIADAIRVAFCDLWGSPQKTRMPFSAILSGLLQLGANPSALKEFGLNAQCPPKSCITRETFLEGLRRLIMIMKAAGCSAAFSSSDVANVVLCLVIMELDPSTSQLGMQLNISLDAICNHSATNHLVCDISERVLGYARQLVPIKKAKLVSYFASGSGQTRCIARYLAYCLLVSTTPNSDDDTWKLRQDLAPPLEPIILLLSPDAGSCELFDVTNESTDYEELRHHVNILSVALFDIAPYVEEERNAIRSASSTSVLGSPSKARKGSAPPLELLHRVLESLQSKIVDTRAAHLDRSRTKAAIHRLMMRIHYDRMALMGIRARRRTSTLKAYFSPQRR